MDVRCARCGIEYEFDDALISERGTMVRCTECGHQFRVHPNHVIPAEPDEWRVVTVSGRTLIFRTLRELQQGISQGEVGRDATLLRGRLPPRPLGSIAELDPFFPTRAGAARQQNTLTGVAPPAAAHLPGAKPSPATGKIPVARVGLSTIQLPADTVSTDVARSMDLRKTAIGIGSPSLGSTLPSERREPPEPKVAPPNSATDEQAQAEKLLPLVETDKAVVAKSRSEPPTLRDGEVLKAAISTIKIAAAPPPDKKGSVPPPRPTRRARPTPAAGTNAVTALSAANPAESAQVITPQKPSTDPPFAQRNTNAGTQLSAQSPVALEPTEPMTSKQAPAARQHVLRPPATEGDTDEGSRLHFRAEAKPIESPPSSPRVPIASPLPEATPFIPTVPPMRQTSAEALGKFAEASRRNSRAGRWLMVILLGALVSLIAMWAHYKQAQSGQNDTANNAAALERRLQTAREALRSGDINLAHENLQATQSLGTRDTRWLTLTARYDIARADMSWLAVRLADPNDTSRLESLKRELSQNVAQSIKALTAVESLATQDPDIASARLDAQRINGDLDKARDMAASLKARNPTPELAYSLASVELMQQRPRYKEVFDWLGQARAQDSGLGRAPVMLVLACIAGNRMESARAEVQRLKLASRSHPLLADIEAYLRRVADQAMAAEQAGAADAGTAANADAGEAETMAEVTREGDFRLRLRRAVESLGRNELTRAEQLFRSVLAERPKDTEAWTGLGDVARRHGNTANAISYYERVLSSNGQYLPALSALAEVKWKSGDREGAATLYRRIVDQVGESPGYGQHAAQRLRELNAGSSTKSSSESEKSAPTEPPPPAAAPNIDTTDLPGKTP